MNEILQTRLLHSNGHPVYQGGSYYKLDPGGFVWQCYESQYTHANTSPWAFTGYRVQL